LALAAAARQAVEICIQRIGDLPRGAGRVEPVGGAIQERTVFADERLPRALVARRAPPRKLDIRRV